MDKAKEEHDYVSLRALEAIEAKLGVPKGFTHALRAEGSDWEFAIKLVVLLEAALTKVIAAHLHNPEVESHVTRLSFNGRSSKVALAQDLGILTKAEGRAMLALAEIRNSIAHDVENIASNLGKFGEDMPIEARAKFIKQGLMVPDEMMDSVKFLWGPSFPTLLRDLMWSMAEILLGVLATQDEHATRETERRARIEVSAKAGEKAFTLDDLFRDFDKLVETMPEAKN